MCNKNIPLEQEVSSLNKHQIGHGRDNSPILQWMVAFCRKIQQHLCRQIPLPEQHFN